MTIPSESLTADLNCEIDLWGLGSHGVTGRGKKKSSNKRDGLSLAGFKMLSQSSVQIKGHLNF